MNFLVTTPLDVTLANWWRGISREYKTAFVLVVLVHLLAFGFEMTNLTLHHDDLAQIFIQDTILGHYLGRFGTGWLHYYTQNAYFMPFLQMIEGILLMTAYGLLVARFWGLEKTLDRVLVAAILGVFPFMAQVYQYNTTMATYSVAHLAVALAVVVSVAATPARVLLAALLYLAAFSIYQSVIACAATLFVLWLLSRLLPRPGAVTPPLMSLVRPTLAAIIAVALGGVAYVACVKAMNIQFDTYQNAGQAFDLAHNFSPARALSEVLAGTRATLVWPEAYFPDYLKNVQLLLIAGAYLICLWIPRGSVAKLSGLVLLTAALFTPRLLQMLHPTGVYHNLTLTGYALLVAGAVMVLLRSGRVPVRNLATLAASFLIAGYLVQANWISTVNYLNTLAHMSTTAEVLTRVHALPSDQWDGKTVLVVGSHPLPSTHPYRRATGVASNYLDAPHIKAMAHLLRADVDVLPASRTDTQALDYARHHQPWPHQESVAAVAGRAVVVMSQPAGPEGATPERAPVAP